MDAIILAAGYATRLYPLTLNKAKPLLEVAGRPMIEWLLDTLVDVPGLETIFIITNDKFASDFQQWADHYQDRQWSRRESSDIDGKAERPSERERASQSHFRLKVINDGSTSDDDKLGAIGDINLAVTRENLSQRELLILAGDNLLSESLAGFVAAAKRSAATVAVYDVGDAEKIKKYGNVTIDSDRTITHFEEKPEKPKSTLAAIGVYYYSPEVVSLVTTYLAAGNNPDQPGRFVQWLYQRKPVKTFQLKGRWLDIGSKETLQEADAIFRKLAR